MDDMEGPHPDLRQPDFTGKTILIVSGGTRGDVTPATSLGVALAGLGAHVRLAADKSFREFVEEAGLEFFPLGGNAKQMMALTVKWGGMLPTEFSGMFWLRSQIKEVMDSVWEAATATTPPAAAADRTKSGPDLAESAAVAGSACCNRSPSASCCSCFDAGSRADADATAVAVAGGSYPHQVTGSGMQSAAAGPSEQVAFKPDIILANQLAYGQVAVAEKLGVPLHILLTIPWLPTTDFAHPWARAFDHNVVEWVNQAAELLLGPVFYVAGLIRQQWAQQLQQQLLPRIAAAANRMSTPLLDHTAWWGIADILTSFRHKLGLSVLSANNLGSAMYRYPTTCLFSPHLVPKPKDWGRHVTLSGFLSLPEALERYGANSSYHSHHRSRSVDSNSSSSSYSIDSTSLCPQNTSQCSTPQSSCSTGKGCIDGCQPSAALFGVLAGDQASTLRSSPAAAPLSAAASPLFPAAAAAAAAFAGAAAATPGCCKSALMAAACEQTPGSFQVVSSCTDGSLRWSSTSAAGQAGQAGPHIPSSEESCNSSCCLPASPIAGIFRNNAAASSAMSSTSSMTSSSRNSYQPPADLMQFLAAGPPPVYVGFGSMVVENPEQLMHTVLQAAEQLQQRCDSAVRLLVCTGWAGGRVVEASAVLQTSIGAGGGMTAEVMRQQDGSIATAAGGAEGCASPSVFFLPEAPHEWLFPRCSALVHHGGVGTTAVGLRHGKPTLVIPAFGDLFFWGDICHVLDVGPKPIPLKEVTSSRLADAMEQLMTQQHYQAAALAVAWALRQEDGLDAAVTSVYNTLEPFMGRQQ